MTEENEKTTGESDRSSGEWTEKPDRPSHERWGEGWHVRPVSSAPAIPQRLNCNEEGTQRYTQGFEEPTVALGNSAHWELRVDKTTLERGETLRVRLMNVTDEPRRRRANSLYNIQLKTHEGWKDVRVFESIDQRGPPTGALCSTDAGGYHEWAITMDEDGIGGDVCPPLQAGRYRFVYFGFEGEDEVAALGVEYDFTG